MAWELKGFSVGNLVADVAQTSNQYKIVKMDTTNNQFTLCSVDGERGIGILQDTPAAGDPGEIMMMGISKVVASEALTAGQFYGTSTSGTAKIVEGTITGADVGDHVLGVVIQGAAASALAVVSIGLHNFRVESQ